MAIRIVAGEIIENKSDKVGKYKRLLTAWDAKFCIMQHTIFADTKEDLVIIDDERT